MVRNTVRRFGKTQLTMFEKYMQEEKWPVFCVRCMRTGICLFQFVDVFSSIPSGDEKACEMRQQIDLQGNTMNWLAGCCGPSVAAAPGAVAVSEKLLLASEQVNPHCQCSPTPSTTKATNTSFSITNTNNNSITITNTNNQQS